MSNIESDQANEDFRSSSEVDFYIHNDMIHIADTKVARRFSDYFIRQIHKLDEVSFLVILRQIRINADFTIRFFLTGF